MKEIQLKDAKATLSAVVDRAVAGEPSIITRHGRKEAVVLAFEEYERLSQVPSFGELLDAFPGGSGGHSGTETQTSPRVAQSQPLTRVFDGSHIVRHSPVDRVGPLRSGAGFRSTVFVWRALRMVAR